MSVHSRTEELLALAERLLRDADIEVNTSIRGTAATVKRRRNAINAACNALHRATRA